MAQFSPVTGRYVTIDVLGDECKVFFLENGEGQPLVCQHTAGCHNHQWRNLLEDEEITSNYRVIAYDLVRHGKSDPPKNKEWWKEEYRLTADYYTAFITAFCDALELEDPIFMGCSLRSKPPTTHRDSTSTGGSTRTPTLHRFAPVECGT
jgi:pimeloyl-ACP methyl ester carboxylesterase